jgi:hypothetical protein
MKVLLNNLVFNSKKECKDFVRNVIKELNIYEIINLNHKYFNLFMELVKRHPEKENKIGVGINYFTILLDGYKKKYLSIKRVDNTQCDISWIKCIDMNTYNFEILLKDAMRFEIREQILEYKFNNPFPRECCKCKKYFNSNDIEIDHYIDFKVLYDNFIKSNPNYPTVFDDEPTFNNAVFKLSDKEYADKWSLYHKENAILQLLCKKCHKNKTFNK